MGLTSTEGQRYGTPYKKLGLVHVSHYTVDGQDWLVEPPGRQGLFPRSHLYGRTGACDHSTGDDWCIRCLRPIGGVGMGLVDGTHWR
jgi:hypothetical protein